MNSNPEIFIRTVSMLQAIKSVNCLKTEEKVLN